MIFPAYQMRHDCPFPHPVWCANIAMRGGFGPAGQGERASIQQNAQTVTLSGNIPLPHCYRESYRQCADNKEKIANGYEVTPSRARIAFAEPCGARPSVYSYMCARVLLRYLSCFSLIYLLLRSNLSGNNAVTVFRRIFVHLAFVIPFQWLGGNRPEKGGF